MKDGSLVKVNLGSGFVGLAGWLNYDNSALSLVARHPLLLKMCVRLGVLPPGIVDIKWPPIIRRDVRRRIPLADDTVDFIYTSHFLEHLYRHETFKVLKECRRVLKTGSCLRVVLPDIDLLFKLYQDGAGEKLLGDWGQDQVPPAMSDRLVSNFYPVELNRTEKPSFALRLAEVLQRRHKWVYSSESMGTMLKSAGFRQTRIMGFRETSFHEAAELDRHQDVSFYIEAMK